MKKGTLRRQNKAKNKKPRVKPRRKVGKHKNPAYGMKLPDGAIDYLLDMAALTVFQRILGVGTIGKATIAAISKIPTADEAVSVKPEGVE